MGSSQSLPANYWFLCGLGKKLEGKRAFQEWLPQQGSGCTRCERLTLTFRHDVWISRVLLKTMPCLFPFPGLWFAPWSSVRVYELGSLFGDTRMEEPQKSWRHKWAFGPWDQTRACKDKTPRRVHWVKVRSSAPSPSVPSTDLASVNFSLWLLLFPAPNAKTVPWTWRLEDDSELILSGEHSCRLLSLWERCGWGWRERGMWLWLYFLPKHFAGGC